MDEPTSLLALGGVVMLYAKQAFDRWMKYKESRRNGGSPTGTLQAATGERGAVGNGTKAITQRLDGIEKKLDEAREDRAEMWRKLSAVVELAGRLDERTRSRG